MDPQPQTPQIDPADLRRQRDLYYHVVHQLHGMMPAPNGEPQQEFERRFRRAITQVAAMLPTNADEADIAVKCVATGEHADDCLRLSVLNAGNPPGVVKLNNQAASMMRQSRGYRSLLLRVQARRYKRESSSDTREQDDWTGYCGLEYMTEAVDELLGPQPAAVEPTPAPAPAAAAQPSSPPEPAERRAAENPRAPAPHIRIELPAGGSRHAGFEPPASRPLRHSGTRGAAPSHPGATAPVFATN